MQSLIETNAELYAHVMKSTYKVNEVAEIFGLSRNLVVQPVIGARKIAESSGISIVRLSPDSTTTDYVLDFLNKS